MSVLGKTANEMTALHLIKTYCLPCLMFGCEIWNLSGNSMHRLNVAWNNCFRHIFQGFWRESVKTLQYYCGSLPLSYMLDQRRLLFWVKMSKSENPVLRTLSSITRSRMIANAALFSIDMSVASRMTIKNCIWAAFAQTCTF